MLRRIVGTGALTLALAVPVTAHGQQGTWAPPGDSVAESLIAREREWAEAECTHRVVEPTLLADDFVGTATDGRLYTKAEAVADAQSSKVEARDCRLIGARVRFFGESLAVVYGTEVSTRRRPGGTDQVRRLIWTDTWLRRNDQWLIVAAQDMRAAEQ